MIMELLISIYHLLDLSTKEGVLNAVCNPRLTARGKETKSNIMGRTE